MTTSLPGHFNGIVLIEGVIREQYHTINCLITHIHPICILFATQLLRKDQLDLTEDESLEINVLLFITLNGFHIEHCPFAIIYLADFCLNITFTLIMQLDWCL